MVALGTLTNASALAGTIHLGCCVALLRDLKIGHGVDHPDELLVRGSLFLVLLWGPRGIAGTGEMEIDLKLLHIFEENLDFLGAAGGFGMRSVQDGFVFGVGGGGRSTRLADFHRRLESHTWTMIVGELWDFDREGELMGSAALHCSCE